MLSSSTYHLSVPSVDLWALAWEGVTWVHGHWIDILPRVFMVQCAVLAYVVVVAYLLWVHSTDGTYQDSVARAVRPLRTLIMVRCALYLSCLCVLATGPGFMYHYALEGDVVGDVSLCLVGYDSNLTVIAAVDLVSSLLLEPVMGALSDLAGTTLSGVRGISPDLQTPLTTPGPVTLTQSSTGALAASVTGPLTASKGVSMPVNARVPLAASMTPKAGMTVACPESDFIQYYQTVALQKGRLALIRMYDHLTDGPVKSFIDQHCAFLHEPLVGDTPVLRAMIHPPIVKADPSTIVLGSTITTTPRATLNGAVYTIMEPGASEYVTYGGMTSSLQGRSFIHFNAMTSSVTKGEGSHPLYQMVLDHYGGHLTGFTLTTLFELEPYMTQYTALHHTRLTPLETHVLRCYTDQYLLSVEQAYLWEACPTSQQPGLQVTVPYVNWVDGYVPNLRSNPVYWVDTDGVHGSRPSTRQAELALSINQDTLRYNANCNTPVWLDSAVGKVTITMDNVPWVDVPSDRARLNTVPLDLSADRLSSLAIGSYALDSELNPVMGPLTKKPHLCQALGLARTPETYALFNTKTILWSTVLGMNVYLVYKGHESLAVRVTNVATGVSQVYNTISSAMQSVNPALSGRKAEISLATFDARHIYGYTTYTHQGVDYRFNYVDPAVGERKRQARVAATVNARAKRRVELAAKRAKSPHPPEKEGGHTPVNRLLYRTGHRVMSYAGTPSV